MSATPSGTSAVSGTSESTRVSGPHLVDDLLRYLQEGRDGLLRALDGLDDYDVRRPITPSGTNLLGLVKHVAGVQLAYLADSVGRPSRERLPWVEDGSIWDSADMWATAEESRADLVGLYERAATHCDAVVRELGLDAPARVAWWPEERRETTLGSLLVRCVAEVSQHAGHADILRESIDGRGGRDHDHMGDDAWWSDYVARIQAAADAHRTVPAGGGGGS
ncbi:DinB family protein [Terrabacter sp. Root181]|uniref:DinB family protein n=1 Tax=Terrabacter sp. Root181 TaxID=1736484 RepID=UPI001F339AB1|nr:DinB family protein [Terrabacter sp. Root181]